MANAGVQISLRLDGDRVLGALNRVKADIPNITKAALNKVMKSALKISPAYKGGNRYGIAKPFGSRYKRTGNLGRWTTLEERGLTFTIISRAYSPRGQAYSVGVLGNAKGQGQWRVHAGRWPTLRSAVDQSLEDAVKEIDNGISKAARQAGIGN